MTRKTFELEAARVEVDRVKALNTELGTTIAELRQSVAALQSQVDAVAPVVESFAETVKAAARAMDSRGKGGQQVPFHGDFCAAGPSVMNRLEWWARQLSTAMKGPT